MRMSETIEKASLEGGPHSKIEGRAKRLSHFESEKQEILCTVDLHAFEALTHPIYERI